MRSSRRVKDLGDLEDLGDPAAGGAAKGGAAEGGAAKGGAAAGGVDWFLLFLLAPAILFIFGVVILPFCVALALSLQKATVFGGGEIHAIFAGLKNYRSFLFGKDHLAFWLSVRLTLYFTMLSLLLELCLGIPIALALQKEFPFQGVIRALVLLPWAVPTVVNARLWQWIYHGERFGALNGLLLQAGILQKNVNWLSLDTPCKGIPLLGSFMEWVGASRALHMIILGDTWKVTPLVVLLVLAALQTIPDSLYEAALLDGAGAWKRFWRVTLPHLKPILLVILILRTMELFRVFDIMYIMMGYSIKVLSVKVFEEGVVFLNLGRGSALAFLIGLFILLLSLLYIRLLHEREQE